FATPKLRRSVEAACPGFRARFGREEDPRLAEPHPGLYSAVRREKPPATCSRIKPRVRLCEPGGSGLRLPIGRGSDRGLLLLGFERLDELLGVLVEGVAAAGAADVVRLAAERHGHRAEAAGDDALVLLGRGGERLTLLVGGHLVDLPRDALALGQHGVL